MWFAQRRRRTLRSTIIITVNSYINSYTLDTHHRHRCAVPHTQNYINGKVLYRFCYIHTHTHIRTAIQEKDRTHCGVGAGMGRLNPLRTRRSSMFRTYFAQSLQKVFNMIRVLFLYNALLYVDICGFYRELLLLLLASST